MIGDRVVEEDQRFGKRRRIERIRSRTGATMSFGLSCHSKALP
jgi:hypothetical protein